MSKLRLQILHDINILFSKYELNKNWLEIYWKFITDYDFNILLKKMWKDVRISLDDFEEICRSLYFGYLWRGEFFYKCFLGPFNIRDVSLSLKIISSIPQDVYEDSKRCLENLINSRGISGKAFSKKENIYVNLKRGRIIHETTYSLSNLYAIRI
ncbi:MAG: hypothetical protein J7L39_03115, partial [Candidatus Aenigmarchaeota archaeon]|nr:hypothetical protein [Candidatus Aenigmarchaeota archaeon]